MITITVETIQQLLLCTPLISTTVYKFVQP
nr:MAG TPA: hypothetical protein [Caudoviricetes sp.]